MVCHAIDVSKHQGDIDWAAVRAAGISHVMIRAGYGKGTVDPYFAANVAGCEANGIAWGAYWYSYAYTPDMARREAGACLAALKSVLPARPSMPIAYDIEYEDEILAQTNETRTAMVEAFCGTVEAAGYYAAIYASTDMISRLLNWPQLKRYDVWAAQYGSVCTCPLPYGMWQYSSGNPLKIPGFGSELDCDRVYKDYPAIIKRAGLNGWPKGGDN